ncbi:hypothetical protein J2I47_14555 [Fibrella sp. HMF5335]|uniref:Uncharacterized protein n=1 Tax=Fibrella rubiginis TaxID=2817060 RepID=A0A939K228_9BACT|nr:hypothetical protein [Fibrella rubiginis]MBO0937777.1 hypothetical protein [Fibrella rubiginis]
MRPLYCLLLVLLGSPAVFATHIMGGYIRATPVAGNKNTCLITVIMYYNGRSGGSAGDEASSVAICIGGGTGMVTVNRGSITQTDDKAVTINQYTTTFTFSGPGVYTIRATAISRSDFMLNIGYGAVGENFSLQTTVQIGISNQTPTLFTPTENLLIARNQRLSLPLNASDAEGDSLTYSLALPMTSSDPNVTLNTFCTSFSALSNYQFPNDVLHTGIFRLNAKTGLLTWDVPGALGRYSVALVVSEWRNGQLISETLQELTLTVVDKPGAICNYNPTSL